MIISVQDYALAGIVLFAGATDLLHRKIYNWLTYPALLTGMAVQGLLQGWPGLGLSLAGALVAALVFFPGFYWGGLGAGDIKLMAVVGAWKGLVFGINTAILAAVSGGVLAILVLLWKGQLRMTCRRMGQKAACCLGLTQKLPESDSGPQTLPYGVAIAIGAFLAYFLPVI